MTIICLFFLLFTSQLFLVTPLVIREEQVQNKEEPLSSEVKKTMNNMERREEVENGEETPSYKVNRTASEPTDPKTLKAPQELDDIPPQKAEQEVDACRRVNLFVKFADLGLPGMIIAPRRFNVYQCKGKCSKTQQKFLNRALLLDLLEKKKGIKTEEEACCVPTKLKPKSVLYFDEENRLVLRTFEDMVVKECGCYNGDRKNLNLKLRS